MRQLRATLDSRLRLDLFMKAHHRASRGKIHRSDVIRFQQDETGNLVHLMEAVRAGAYQPAHYFHFTIHEPKERQIVALPYPDRVLHQWVVEEFYLPYFTPRFIHDSYACIRGRGTHAAVDRLQSNMRQMRQRYGDNYYALKMDISQYFNSIDRDILANIMHRVIADPALWRLTKSFIYCDDLLRGIPIGNYTSQLFANVYLNELDQFCKHQLHQTSYLRYMDDFIVLVPDRVAARELYGQIERFLNERLHLRLNPKSHYFPARQGIDFVGYRTHCDYRLLRARSKRKLQLIIRAYQQGQDSTSRFITRANAWYGYASHADCYRYVYKMLSPYRPLLPRIFGDRIAPK